MFFAWVWKDVVSPALALAGGAVWCELLITIAVMSLLVDAETLPSFRSATRAVQERGDGDTPLLRMVAMLQNLALAVRSTWNFLHRSQAHLLICAGPDVHLHGPGRVWR